MIIDILKNILTDAFKNAGYNTNCMVVVSNRPELCDYQCDDAFKLAKVYHEAPFIIANKVIDNLKQNEDLKKYFKLVEVANPGFINLTLSDYLINDTLNSFLTKEHFGLKTANPLKYFLDYGGPNVAKPLHVGHLRSAVVGESIKRIIEYAGNKTISDVHLGDYGLQIGEVIYGLKERGVNPAGVTLELLEEIYPNISARCKEDERLKEECAEITKQLQDGNEEYKEYWKPILAISKGDIKRLYDYLGVHFDIWNGESEAYEYLPGLFEKYSTNGKLIKSEGAYIIPVAKETDSKELPPLIFRKSNGAYLYGSTDIATVFEREQKYSPDKYVYIADLRQSLHFEQFFRACDILEIAKKEKFIYCGFGTVNGSDGKPFKTRVGDSPKLDSLFKQVKEVLIKNRPDNSFKEEDLDILVNAVIKFADLQNNREKEYIFDIEKFSKISGKTGPYILYTYLRLSKILANENIDKACFSSKISNEYERKLKLSLLNLHKSFSVAYDEFLPSYICDFLFELCNTANTFYEQNRIKNENDLATKNSWLKLIKITTSVIKEMLGLLIIDIPSIM